MSAQRREVFRPLPAVALWWVWAVFAVASLADIAVQGRGHTAAVTAAVIVFVTGVMYACALRPRVVADGTGIIVVNPLRDHHVPWAAVTAVDVGDVLQVHCQRPDGGRDKVVHSWALQSPRRRRARAELRARRAGSPRPAGYARLPAEARQLAARDQAEVTAQALAGRAAAAGAPGAPGGGPDGGAWTAQWAWWPIAAVALPALALVGVILW